jgi:hypothetical protein
LPCPAAVSKKIPGDLDVSVPRVGVDGDPSRKSGGDRLAHAGGGAEQEFAEEWQAPAQFGCDVVDEPCRLVRVERGKRAGCCDLVAAG